MTPTPEQIAAYADGQLKGAEHDAVAAAIEADPALQQQVSAHLALRDRLAVRFAPIAAEPVPDRLAALLTQPAAEVVDLAEVRARRSGLPRWIWAAAPALAASLVLAVMLTNRGGPAGSYADAQLAAALDSQLVAEQPAGAPVRVLLSFRDKAGTYCRAFTRQKASGIACREPAGWKLRSRDGSAASAQAEYRQAGSDAQIMQAAQAMASGPALDAGQERAARADGWRQTP